MATTEQIANVRFEINDTDANHYAFTDSEVGGVYDDEGTVFRAAKRLWLLISGSADKMKKILQVDLTEGFALEATSRIIDRIIESLEAKIISSEASDFVQAVDDEDYIWDFDWEEYVEEMIS